MLCMIEIWCVGYLSNTCIAGVLALLFCFGLCWFWDKNDMKIYKPTFVWCLFCHSIFFIILVEGYCCVIEIPFYHIVDYLNSRNNVSGNRILVFLPNFLRSSIINLIPFHSSTSIYLAFNSIVLDVIYELNHLCNCANELNSV